jgi:hypothetical protein
MLLPRSKASLEAGLTSCLNRKPGKMASLEPFSLSIRYQMSQFNVNSCACKSSIFIPLGT